LHKEKIEVTNIYIDNEGDMETGIVQVMELAKLRGKKFITLAFPSDFMHKVFMVNLCSLMEEDGSMPDNVNIEATIVLPPEEDSDGKGISGR
jgi:hypothetical protein